MEKNKSKKQLSEIKGLFFAIKDVWSLLYVHVVWRFLAALRISGYNFIDSYNYRYNFADWRADIRWLRFTSDEHIIDLSRHRVERLKCLECMCSSPPASRCNSFYADLSGKPLKTREVEARGVHGTIDFFPIASVKLRVAVRVKGYTIHNPHSTVRNDLGVGHRKFRKSALN